MIVDLIKASKRYLRASLIADSEAGGQMPDREKVHEKIRISKSRRIPVIKLLLLFAVILLVIFTLEHFI